MTCDGTGNWTTPRCLPGALVMEPLVGGTFIGSSGDANPRNALCLDIAKGGRTTVLGLHCQIF